MCGRGLKLHNVNDLTWHDTNRKLLEDFIGESILFREEVDLGVELLLKAVEHSVFDHEVSELAVGQKHDVRRAAEVLVDVGLGVSGRMADVCLPKISAPITSYCAKEYFDDVIWFRAIPLRAGLKVSSFFIDNHS